METTKLKIISVDFVKVNTGEVLARADIHFDGFLLKGFKVLRDKEGKEYITPPSYKSEFGWRPLFKTDSVEDWGQIIKRVLQGYNEYLIKESLQESNYEKTMY